MKSIGIIASDNERLCKYKWYEFWRNFRPNFIYFDEYDLCFVVAYQSQNVNKIFEKENIKTALLTKKALPYNPGNAYICSGEKIYIRLIPTVVKKIMKIKNIDKESSSLAIVDENLSVDTLMLIEKLNSSFKYITLVTKDSQKAKIITEKIFDEYGLALMVNEVYNDTKCDIAVKFTENLVRFPKDTIVIDKFGVNNIENKNVIINNLDLSLKIRLPIAVNTISLCEALELESGENADFKLNAFMHNDKVVKMIDIQ